MTARGVPVAGHAGPTAGAAPDLPLWMTTAPHNGTRTSRDSASEIRPHSTRLRAVVLAYVVSRGAEGATAEEVERATGLAGNTVRPRLVELRESGCIEDSGVTRRTAAGRKAVAWRFKP